MSFDVGMGRCTEITDDSVTVKLDSVLVHKWFPAEPWRRPGTSLLRFDRKLCSTERPPPTPGRAPSIRGPGRAPPPGGVRR